MTIMAPKDERELRDMLRTAFALSEGPVTIRYPRGVGVGAPIDEPMQVIPIGSGEVLRDGTDVAIISVGVMAAAATEAATRLAGAGIKARVINARFVKPLDDRLILQAAAECGCLVTIEENVSAGGFGSGVLELLAESGKNVPVATLGIPDRIFEQASQKRLRELAGIDEVAIVEAVMAVRAQKEITRSGLREASAAL